VGERDPEWGETVNAYVVLREDASLSEAHLITFCKEYLADYKVPKQIKLVNDLKRNELGKVTAKTLRDQV
jgi:acyl-CoA synthetase (AMP-forming)/AMP-acid ligase II